MREALFYEKLSNNKVRCNLCGHRCVVHNSKIGVCGVRKNIAGQLYALNYGLLISQHVDPIEKKPLYHFYPGSKAYSIATVGCNFKCGNCQNYYISQLSGRENRIEGEMVTAEEVVEQAIEYGCKSIAYTYTEPTIFYEFALDVAKLAHQKGLKNIFITNGYITPEALQTIAPYLDAANIDLKSFSKKFYQRICKAKMQPVLDTLNLLKKLGIWFEVTTLIIPTLNDSNEQLQAIAEFIIGLGKEIPWHISAFYPAYQLKDIPPTPRRLLYRAWEIGLNFGLQYVYIGNIDTTEFTTTHCPNCGRSVIRRRFYVVVENCISNARCPFCGVAVAGIALDSQRESDRYDITKLL